MTIKASNPYSKEEKPIAWHGWECGFWSKPNTDCSQTELAFYGEEFQKGFYRGQGAAQIVKNYNQPSALAELEFIVKSAR